MSDPAGKHERSTALAIVVASSFAVAQVLILLHVAWYQSDTVDETRYVAAAASLWAHGENRDLCEAPALPKRAFGLALALAEPSLSTTPRGWQHAARVLITGQSPAPLRRLFFTARCATIASVVLAGWFVFAAASRFGTGAALVSLALWCFSPTLLANGSLAALDAWAACLMAVVLWASVRLLERRSVARTLAAGMACGGAAATKITTLLVVPLVAGALLWPILGQRRSATTFRAIGRVGLLAAALVFTLWAIYGGSFGGVSITAPCPFSIVDAPRPEGWLPFPAWLEGVLFQLRHGQTGHANYLFGEVRTEGWWWFYLACIALKVPIGTQALGVLGAVAAFVSARRDRSAVSVDAALLAYPALLLAAMSLGKHQANIAFLLPALPFVCVWLGRSAALSWNLFGRLGRSLVVLLLLLSVSEALRVHPHYLMFFNAWAGGPEQGPRFLVHREDWGQGKRLLAEWQRQHGIARLYYAPYGPNAEEWGIVYSPVPCQPTPGVYALHAAEVHRPQFALAPGCVDWLTVEPPDERLGYSIYIYVVDEARIRRLAEQRSEPPFWRSAPPDGSRAGSSP